MVQNTVQNTVQSVQSATAAAVAQVTAPPATRPRRRQPPTAAPATNPLAPLTALPVSISIPITALANEIGSTLLPGQNATTGTNTTTQSSPLANVDAPINVCSLSIGLLAGAVEQLLDHLGRPEPARCHRDDQRARSRPRTTPSGCSVRRRRHSG